MEILKKLKSQQALSAIAQQVAQANKEVSEQAEQENLSQEEFNRLLENTVNNITAIGLQVQALSERFEYLENLVSAILTSNPEIAQRLNAKIQEYKQSAGESNEM